MNALMREHLLRLALFRSKMPSFQEDWSCLAFAKELGWNSRDAIDLYNRLSDSVPVDPHTWVGLADSGHIEMKTVQGATNIIFFCLTDHTTPSGLTFERSTYFKGLDTAVQRKVMGAVDVLRNRPCMPPVEFSY